MKRYADIAGDGGSGVVAQVVEQRQAIAAALAGVRHLVATRAKVVAVFAVDEPAQVRHEGESIVVAPGTLAWAALPAGAEVAVTGASALWMEIEPWA